MNATEKIIAATQKLEQLKVEASPTWDLRGGNEWFYPWGIDVGHEDESTYVIPPGDAALAVALHRTIDAQLEILRTSLTLDGLVPMTQVGDLADAILGVTS